MPVIRITDPTWNRLKNWAVPLEDSPEDAIKKVLEAAEEHLKCTRVMLPTEALLKPKTKPPIRRLPGGVRTPQSAFREPIIETLKELGGKGSVEKILQLIGKKMHATLNEVDFQKLPSTGITRWENTAQWERFKLVGEGVLKQDSPRGTWELN